MASCEDFISAQAPQDVVFGKRQMHIYFFRLRKFERTNISDFQGPKNGFNLDHPGPPIPVVDSLLIPIYTHIHKYTQILKLVEGYLTGNPKVYIYIRLYTYNIV